ncbi:MAG: carboxypeptidase regulatory-like domain-containing protein [Planctomycetaceae bacterium]|nr:carboxypeptidase regulatory-like domain-containing protein [Planctomycetaceae bacterium]
MIESLNSIADRWTSWQVEMLWQVAVLVAIVWAVDLAIRRWAWPQVRYALWMLVLLKLLVPPSLTSPVSVTSQIPQAAQKIVSTGLNGTQADGMEAVLHDEAAGANATAKQSPSTSLGAGLTVPPNGTQSYSLRPGLEGEPAADQHAEQHGLGAGDPLVTSALSWQAWAMLSWIGGVAGLSAWLMVRLAGLRKEHKGADVQPLPASFNELLSKTAERLRLRRLPEVIFTERVPCPAVFGIVRPVLLMPAKMARDMQTRDIEHVLLHELAHIKRGDLLVHAAFMLLQIVYWFNPLLWMIRKTLQNLREVCCDATVAKLLKDDTIHYRQTLLETARRLLAQPITPALGLLGLFENSNWLVTRLQWLEKKTWKNRPLRIVTVVVLVSIMTVCVLPMANKATENSEFKVTGTVTDAATGLPIAGAEVYDDGYDGNKARTTTDADGRFALKTANEEHNISAKADGYMPQLKTLTTWPLANYEKFDFALAKQRTEDRDQTAEEAANFTAALPNGVTVELLGICEHPSEGKQWWRPDGTPMERPYQQYRRTNLSLDQKIYEIAYNVSGGNRLLTDFSVNEPVPRVIDWSRIPFSEPDTLKLNGCLAGLFSLDRVLDKADLMICVGSDSLWQTDTQINRRDGRSLAKTSSSGPHAMISAPIEKEGVTFVHVAHNLTDRPYRIIAVDLNGTIRLHQGGGSKLNQDARLGSITAEFDLPLAEIQAVQFQTQRFQTVTFKNVSLRPGVKTNVEVSIDDGRLTKDEQTKAASGSDLIDKNADSAAELKELSALDAKKAAEDMEAIENVWGTVRSMARKDTVLASETMKTGLPHLQAVEKLCENTTFEAGAAIFSTRYNQVMDKLKTSDTAEAKKMLDSLGELGNSLEKSIEEKYYSSLHSIEFDITSRDFLGGDSIEITEILGTSGQFEIGQTYEVKGTYELASHDAAVLHLYATGGETRSDQGPDIVKGTGEFKRTFEFIKAGDLHLSFYPAGGGESFGGIYFAEKGTVGSVDLAPAGFRMQFDEQRKTFSLVVSIKNEGATALPKHKIRFYQGAPKNGLDETGNPQSGYHEAGPIEPGKEWNERTRDFYLPDGEYAFAVVLDYDNAIAESNEANNTMELRVTIKGGKIDGQTSTATTGQQPTDRFEGAFELDKDIAVNLIAGTAEQADIVKINSIRFKRQGEQILQKIDGWIRPWPHTDWRFRIDLLDAQGKALDSLRYNIHNRGRSDTDTTNDFEPIVSDFAPIGPSGLIDSNKPSRFTFSIVQKKLETESTTQMRTISGTVVDATENWPDAFFDKLDTLEKGDDAAQWQLVSEMGPKPRPLAGVVVNLKGKSVSKQAITDAQGKFEFKDLPGPTYGPYGGISDRPTYEVTARINTEHAPAAISQTVELENDKNVTMTYRSDLISIKGKVADSSGKPLAGAKVTATLGINDISYEQYLETHEPQQWHAVTDSDGSYELTGIEPANWHEVGGYLYSGTPNRYVDICVEAAGFTQDKPMRVPLLTEKTLAQGRRFAGFIERAADPEDLAQMKRQPVTLPALSGNTISGIDIILNAAPVSAGGNYNP